MIEDQETYRNKCKELYDIVSNKMELMDKVNELIERYGDMKLGELKVILKEEITRANDEYDEFTKEVVEALAKINEKYDTEQIITWIANGASSLDLVNSYLSSKI